MKSDTFTEISFFLQNSAIAMQDLSEPPQSMVQRSVLNKHVLMLTARELPHPVVAMQRAQNTRVQSQQLQQ